jgi:predicted lipoprotein with Yx(FWY)xxD motif
MRRYIAFVGFLAVMLVVAGCTMPLATSQPAAAPAPTAAPTEAAPTEAMAATLMVSQQEGLGQFLTDEQGLSLYLFTKDTPNTSTCYDRCAENWPPLLTSGSPVAGQDVDAALLGTTQRQDGSTQVTYNGWPLYYYVKDQQPGDTTGQEVGDVWYVISPQGQEIGPMAATEAAPTEAMATTLMISQQEGLGQFLTDEQGLSLYLFTKDTPNTSNCYDQCAENWPPLLTSGSPVAGQDVDAALLGTTQRQDGSTQITYNGWPLYYYVKDQQPGDTTGQEVGDVWYLVTPQGEQVEAQAAMEAAPAEAAGATLMVSQQEGLGQFLTDEQGLSLYLFTKDTPNTSNCYDQCAENWPPLLTSGSPVAGQDVDAALLGTTQRQDGSTQVTYNGWPLYYYVKDQQPGDTTGQEVGDVWYLVTPQGEQVEAQAAMQVAPAPASSASGSW